MSHSRIDGAGQWRDLDPRGMLERRPGFPVTISNDVACSMLAERFFGHGDKSDAVHQDRPASVPLTLTRRCDCDRANHAGGEIGISP
ncbi:MAG: hypothetical protein ACLVEF_00730 [Bifidobacterium bifidum]